MGHKIRQYYLPLLRYHLRIIFGGKFIYFVVASVGLFLLTSLLSLFGEGAFPNNADVYGFLLFPGLLLIFYPSAFGIQNELDAKTLELSFGVPDYRYRIWLARLLLLLATIYFTLILLGLLSWLIYYPPPLFEMAFQLMFPIAFVGTLAFYLSTLIRSGSGTAAVVAIAGFAIFLLGETIGGRWNIFLNPFSQNQDMSLALWVETVYYNRIILGVGTALFTLGGLLNLQRREKFM